MMTRRARPPRNGEVVGTKPAAAEHGDKAGAAAARAATIRTGSRKAL